MTLSVMVLGVPACVVLGVIARCGRDLAVLRRLERLLEGCDQEQRVEVCRVLAASLHAVGRAEPRDEPPPSDPAAREAANLQEIEAIRHDAFNVGGPTNCDTAAKYSNR